ncbi:MAG TPA: hypothetical protein VGD89_05815 [Flavipsychrobacter sp.]
MKKHMYIVLSVAVLLLASCKGEQQQQQGQEDELSKQLPELDRLAGDYTPQQEGDFKTYHLALKGRVMNGVWMIDSNATYMRPGRLPYGAASGGDMMVVYTDASGKELGKYRVEHPGKQRTCDDGNGGMKVATSYDFEILLPGREDIGSVALQQDGKTVQQFKVPTRRSREERQIPSTNVPGAADTTRVIR